MKRPMFTLTLLAAPALALALASREAVAAPQVAVRQSAPPHVPTITVRSRSILRTRIIANEFRVVWPLPAYVVLESVQGPPVRLTLQTSIRTSIALRQGEIVRLKIVPVRGRP